MVKKTMLLCFLFITGQSKKRGSVSKQPRTTVVTTGVTADVLNLNDLRRHPVTAGLCMQKVIQNGNTVSTICLWSLRTQR